ncbi:MAG: 6-aminohexanoate hydrolase [Scytonema sp. PMC 1069.18]|nr:6-aminohexanoate hydrolase [Scytonema sp. PMC 1069.18]MEC4885617.1 6-aminohexanoate hydrolase [Scytonema sp. PMC 1070.18]
MTQTNDRLDRIENELAAVRQLLTSAAIYAESANRGVDRLTAAQAQTQAQLDSIIDRVDVFVSESQRLFTRLGTVAERVDGRTESLEVVVRRLDRNYEEQKSQFQEFKQTTEAALSRIDRLLDYLVKRDSGSNPPS